MAGSARPEHVTFRQLIRAIRRRCTIASPLTSRPRIVVIPEQDLIALTRIFGASAASVKVVANSRFAKLHRALATTRRNRIYLAAGSEFFLRDPKLMLHEYYHVLAQWNCGELSAGRYVWESLRNGYRRNCYEIAACRFADAHLAEFENLRRGGGST
ncbi:MAG: hypothetical protein ACREBC_31180, partial [Pyrinomonadaceae bacterium]